MEDLASHLKKLFELINPTCVIDVGANHGAFSQMLRDQGYEGWIISFEPIKALADELKAKADNRTRVFNFALGDEESERELQLTKGDVFSSFYDRSEFSEQRFQGSAVVGTQLTQVRRLYACWEECLDGVPLDSIYLKVDTQGHDLEVLKGAGVRLNKVVALQCELSFIPVYERVPGYVELLNFAEYRGFRASGFYPITRDDDLSLIEADCVMVRR